MSSVLRQVGLLLGGASVVVGLLVAAATVGGFVAIYAGGAAINAGPVVLAPVNEPLALTGLGGPLANVPREATGSHARALRAMIEAECWPATNGLAVIGAHLWYNAITDGYDRRYWIEDKAYFGIAFYVSGNRWFYRNEANGDPNRVLDCPFTAPEAEARLLSGASR